MKAPIAPLASHAHAGRGVANKGFTMMSSLAIRATFAACVLTAVTGCSQQYNGAWAFSNPADEQAENKNASRFHHLPLE